MNLDELYMEAILEHSRSPLNYGKPERYTHRAEGDNPLCGDHIVIYANANDKVSSVAFEGSACAICTASASMLTKAATGRDRSALKKLHEQFREMVTTGSLDSYEDLGELVALAGVRKYPIRVKCATLPWHALVAALQKGDVSVTTEE